MRQPGAHRTELTAVEIVRCEEVARGWKPGPPLSKAEERREGCDFFSTPPDGGNAHPVEVKGWGEPLVGEHGFTYPGEINAEQFRRASWDPRWRLEIVANLSAVREGTGTPQRLSLRAVDVIDNAKPSGYRFPLEGFEDRVEGRPGTPAAEIFYGAGSTEEKRRRLVALGESVPAARAEVGGYLRSLLLMEEAAAGPDG
jgi:hypothetical protein